MTKAQFWVTLLKIHILTKQRLKEQIDQFPDEFSIDELVERLILIDKVDSAEKQSINNDVIPHSKVDSEIEKWFK